MGEAEQVEILLRASEIFGGLDPEDRADCARAFREIRIESGRVIFSHGDPGDRAYLVGEGLIRLAINTAAGRELSVRIAKAGDLIGEIGALDGGPRTAEATAISPVVAYAVTAAELDRLITEKPALARAAVHFLCRRLRSTTDQLEGIALHRIEVRVARFLLDLLGDREPEPGRRLSLELGYSQGELARLVGSSRPKLNLALGVLEQAGAIKRTSDRLFCDPALLARIVEAEDG
ncbi:Crp/Fnr family transcriptional regulator [Zavarzinia compransoris]|uniref:Crp/Fnr family transcriptional regulator n=1 Tax=Zavarzinia marina TaxID=2911065 RepID=UPI001F1F88D3|nr:Crp/Fnr family transcriptional regulator [Zavarzinia marina]MCF4166744.1 Crp/Fnr family transcriptional regulator [Zavarzinia marina]